MRSGSIVGALAFCVGLLVACGDDTSSSGGGSSSGGADAGGAGTGGATAAEPADVTAAIDACYATLHGDTSGRAQAIALLEAATAAHPDNARAHLFLGMCSLAALAEDNDVTALSKILPALERAQELAPEDTRIPGWIGTVKVQTAVVLHDDAGLAAAIDEMIAAADLDPQFNNVSLAIAFATLPIDTPYPQMAVDRLDAIKDCGATDERCRDNAAAPHNVPGSGMLFGDVYARIGDATTARTYYEAAMAADSAGSWAAQADAQAILDGVDARAAAWADTDTTNDPAFFLSGARTCTGCHQ